MVDIIIIETKNVGRIKVALEMLNSNKEKTLMNFFPPTEFDDLGIVKYCGIMNTNDYDCLIPYRHCISKLD